MRQFRQIYKLEVTSNSLQVTSNSFLKRKLQVTVYKLEITSYKLKFFLLTWKLVKQVLKVIIERKLLSYIFKGSGLQTKYIHSHEIELNIWEKVFFQISFFHLLIAFI